MLKKITGFILLIVIASSAFSQNKDEIIGKWVSSSGGAHILIYKKGEKYCGRIIWLKNPNDEQGKPKIDLKNPDPELRIKPAVGLEVLKNFIYVGEGVWENGTIYDPKSGRTYSCKMTMNGTNNLDIRGYMGITMLGRTENWTRATL